MSPKELLYIEDGLNQEQFCISQCQKAAQELQDQQLQQCVQQLQQKHEQVFGQLFQLV